LEEFIYMHGLYSKLTITLFISSRGIISAITAIDTNGRYSLISTLLSKALLREAIRIPRYLCPPYIFVWANCLYLVLIYYRHTPLGPFLGTRWGAGNY